jgi:hypothetical protein
MSRPRRRAGALVTVLVALTTAGCTAPWPPPSCGEYTLERGESIPKEAVDCMSRADEDDALRITVPTTEGDPIVTVYRRGAYGGFVMDVDSSQDRHGGYTRIFECVDAVSVVDLGECEELHQGH